MDQDRQAGSLWPDPRALAQDWITICQSEMAALGTDREAHEHLAALVAVWAAAAQAATAWLPTAPPAFSPSFSTSPTDERPAVSRAAAPQRATPAGAASDAPDDASDAILRLSERVAELEQRLAERDRGTAAPV